MKSLIASIAVIAAFALPSVASAHSGSVACDSTGVVFSYRADFPVTTTVTESVNGVTKTFIVPRRTAVTDTVPFNAAIVVVSSTWSGGGSIPPTTLTCPYVPPTPPVVPPAPVCPAGTTDVGMSDGVKLCEREKIVIVPAPVPPTPMPLCPKGTKNLGVKNGILTCERTKIKTVTKTKIKWKIKLVEWCPLPPKPTPPGVLA